MLKIVSTFQKTTLFIFVLCLVSFVGTVEANEVPNTPGQGQGHGPPEEFRENVLDFRELPEPKGKKISDPLEDEIIGELVREKARNRNVDADKLVNDIQVWKEKVEAPKLQTETKGNAVHKANYVIEFGYDLVCIDDGDIELESNGCAFVEEDTGGSDNYYTDGGNVVLSQHLRVDFEYWEPHDNNEPAYVLQRAYTWWQRDSLNWSVNDAVLTKSVAGFHCETSRSEPGVTAENHIGTPAWSNEDPNFTLVYEEDGLSNLDPYIPAYMDHPMFAQVESTVLEGPTEVRSDWPTRYDFN
ncbi:hypothetical protein [Natranaerobius trueperi]|uniref:Uncharacterized protein n=1 Tax=Natranaerobius trueperi TaxID=759412 RepID=A0A226C1U8_9FIRM|nr:hypothetical protein [Natranaerobius trueperi]OWZ84387.1 hypothetical protein CDO51_03750 [Natranaerobius trueperi]